MVKHLGDSAKMQKEIPKIGTLGIVVTGRKVIPKVITEKVWSSLPVREC